MTGITVRLGKRSGREGEVLWLEGSEIVIGRSRDCDLTLENDGVSRRHCRIRLHGDRWIAKDLGSQNGLFLNKRRIREVEIRPGDDLLLGGIGPHFEVLALTPSRGPADSRHPPKRAVRSSPKPARPPRAPAAAGIETVQPVDAGPPQRRRRVGRWLLLLAAIGAAAVAYVDRERMPAHWEWAKEHLREWTAQRGDTPSPSPDRPEPIGAPRMATASAGGEYRFLRLVTTAYSRNGKKPGERLDVVTTIDLLPVRVSAGRSVERALADAQDVLASHRTRDESDVRAWLAQSAGDELVISRKLELDSRSAAAELDPASLPAPNREVERGVGPPW